MTWQMEKISIGAARVAAPRARRRLLCCLALLAATQGLRAQAAVSAASPSRLPSDITTGEGGPIEPAPFAWSLRQPDGTMVEVSAVDDETAARLSATLRERLKVHDRLVAMKFTLRVSPRAAGPVVRDPRHETVTVQEHDGSSFASLAIAPCHAAEPAASKAMSDLPPEVAACQAVTTVDPGDSLVCVLLFRGGLDVSRVESVTLRSDDAVRELEPSAEASPPVQSVRARQPRTKH